MVDDIPIRFFDGVALIYISFVSLLPFDIYEDVFAIEQLLPIFTGGHYLSDEVGVVAVADVIFEGLCGDVDGFVYEVGFGDCV